MREPTAVELAVHDVFGGGITATSFTCDSNASLVPPAGFRMEIYQVIFSNTGLFQIQAGIGGT